MQWNPRYLALAAAVLGAYAVAQQAPAPLKAQPAKPAKAAAPAGPKILTGAEELELLRNPKALGPKAAPLSAAELRAAFANPPAANRSMPLWVWNDELEWPRLREQLAQFKARRAWAACSSTRARVS